MNDASAVKPTGCIVKVHEEDGTSRPLDLRLDL
jgi:hypothetical protein